MNMDRAPNTPHRWYRSRVLAWSDTEASEAQHEVTLVTCDDIITYGQPPAQCEQAPGEDGADLVPVLRPLHLPAPVAGQTVHLCKENRFENINKGIGFQFGN